MTAPANILSAREARERADGVSVASDACEVMLEAIRQEFDRVRGEIQEAPRRDFSHPSLWRQLSSLIAIAQEKASKAVAEADALAGATIRPDDAGRLLRGAGEVGKHLGISAGNADHLDKAGQLPTFRLPGDGTLHATAAGLDDWRQLAGAAGALK